MGFHNAVGDAQPQSGTRHLVLGSGTHDAHLDATVEWAAALREALTGPPDA